MHASLTLTLKRNERSTRDPDSLRTKLDRLTNLEKPTESASGPDSVKREKKIANNMLGKAGAVAVRDGEDENIAKLISTSLSSNGEQCRRRDTTGVRFWI